MDYVVSVVPPGGGEQDHQFTVREATFIPRSGEYIVLREKMDTEGQASAFKVRYAVTYINTDEIGGDYSADAHPILEAEPIIHAQQSENHRKLIESYGVTEEYPESGY